MEDFGYGGCAIKIKCDQEPAIVELQRNVGNERRGKTVPVNSPVGDLHSHGKVENAIKGIQASIRTLKHATEAEIGTKINNGHPLFPWMVEWAADLVTRYSMNAAGRTINPADKGIQIEPTNCQVWGEDTLHAAEDIHQAYTKDGREISRRNIPWDENEVGRNHRGNCGWSHKGKD